MYVTAKFIDDRYRIVDEISGQVVYKRNGKAWDGGGHANISTAIQQASLINSGIETDETRPSSKNGIDGKPGRDGRDGFGISFKGSWSPDNTYNLNDLVRLDGHVFIWTNPNPGNENPFNQESWKLFLERGMPGPPGQGGVGTPGPKGEGVPAGGSTGQVLKKSSDDDYDTEWATDETSSGGSSPSSFTGVYATLSADELNATGDGTGFVVGSDSGFSELKDDDSELNSATGVYSADGDGFRNIYFSSRIDNMFGRDADLILTLTSSTYGGVFYCQKNGLNTSGEQNFPQEYRYFFSGTIPMEDGDSFNFSLTVGESGDPKTVNILSSETKLIVMKV